MNEPQETQCSATFDEWCKTRGVWPRLTHEEIWHTAWNAAIKAADDKAEHHGHLAAERPDRSNQLNYAGGGYATDSRGNYREAFWAGTP